MASPCPGYRVTTGYKVRGSWAAGYHTGVDHAAPHGTRIVAIKSGTVTHVGWGGWGNAYGVQVHIRHGSYVTMTAHMSRTTVRRGQQVSEGQQIGNVGTTGNSTGPHVHVETRVWPYGYNRFIRDPQQFYRSGPAPTYLSKLHYGQRNSRSVKNLQRRLNKHLKAGLPITGYYGPMTDMWVRRDQRRHGAKFGQSKPDPKRRSNVGPRQARHLRLPRIRR
jgi:murein DD-endopeptidase MepM/ murein hydrolase activator NlpD